ncbi:MAG: DUF1922 domain-containing protein [Promethearchaeota archaeon]|jgi:hypothetical protein
MEDIQFKKDETPYLIFACYKCKQFLYAKTTQKTRKCLRCGRMHKIEKIIDSGEIVYGMTRAVNEVKRKQNELAIKEYGHNVEFRSFEDFKVHTQIKSKSEEVVKSNLEAYPLIHFRNMLLEISDIYPKFPFYLIEIMAEDNGIPSSELNILVKDCLKAGFLIKTDPYYYKVSQN